METKSLSVDHLLCEFDTSGGGRSVSFRVTAYPRDARAWRIALALQIVVYIVIYATIQHTGWDTWQRVRGDHPFDVADALAAAGALGTYLATLVATLLSMAYAKTLSAELSPFHPRLRRSLTLRWEEPEDYRDLAGACPKVVLDGRGFEVGDLVGIAISRGEASVRQLHLVFRHDAVLLGTVTWQCRAAAESFAQELAPLLGCSVYAEMNFDIRFGRGYRGVALGVFAPATLLGGIGAALTLLFHLALGPFVLLATLGLNLLIPTWGARRLVHARQSAHEQFMHELQAQAVPRRAGP